MWAELISLKLIDWFVANVDLSPFQRAELQLVVCWNLEQSGEILVISRLKRYHSRNVVL